MGAPFKLVLSTGNLAPSMISHFHTDNSSLVCRDASQQTVARIEDKVAGLKTCFLTLKEQNQFLVDKLASSCTQHHQRMASQKSEIEDLKQRVKNIKEALDALREKKHQKLLEASQKVLQARDKNNRAIAACLGRRQDQISEAKKRINSEQMSRQNSSPNRMIVVLEIFEGLQNNCLSRLEAVGKEYNIIHKEYNLASGVMWINDLDTGCFKVGAAKCRRYWQLRFQNKEVLNQYCKMAELYSRLKAGQKFIQPKLKQ